MDRVNILTRSRVHSKLMNQLSILTNGNLGKYLNAVTEIWGVVSQKQVNGIFDKNLQLEINTTSSVVINPGVAISNNDNEVRLMVLPAKEIIDATSLLNDIPYNVYIVPKESNYETGLLTFTNGSKVVSVAGGTFNKLDPYESLVIEDSLSGNDGVYEIYSPGTDTLELVEPFTGTTETDLKYKIAANFKGYKTATEIDLEYAYDGFDVVVSSLKLTTGFILGTFQKTAGIVTTLTDRRSNNLYTIKAIGKVLADSVITGITNAITTIEEKASAATMDKVITDFVTSGYRSGLVVTLVDETLVISSGIAYTALGKRIHVETETVIDLAAAVTNGQVVTGENKLYLGYVSPNSYEWIWNNQTKGAVAITDLGYNIDLRPSFYIVSDLRAPVKQKLNSVVFEEKPMLTFLEREVYYEGGILYYYQLDPTSREGGVLRQTELINIHRLNELLNAALNGVAKSERIRFSLYPSAEKESWFFNNGIQSPTLIGYQSKIVGWRVGLLEAGAPAVNSQIYDYTEKEVLATSKISGIVAKALEFVAPADSTLGVYFSGAGSINTIKLMVNGVAIDTTNMQAEGDTLGEAAINKVYQVEVRVESTESVITIVPTTEE